LAEPHKQLLILDLDETLMYATEKPLERRHDFEVGRYVVYKRPFVEEFIRTCAEWFELAVWTTSTEAYAAAVTPHLFPSTVTLSFAWARKRCTPDSSLERDERSWMKDLKKVKKLGYRLEQVIVVDDSPEKLKRNYGNLVRVKPFTGALEDTELNVLLAFLERLTAVDDVRKIEKRNWKGSMSAGP
jgi:Dullard-like phosphatase family protein